MSRKHTIIVALWTRGDIYNQVPPKQKLVDLADRDDSYGVKNHPENYFQSQATALKDYQARLRERLQECTACVMENKKRVDAYEGEVTTLRLELRVVDKRVEETA